MGGYSPDPDHVYVTDNYASAVVYLVDTLERWWDSDYDSDDDKMTVDARYVSAHADLNNIGDSESELSVTVYDANGYAHYLWITQTDEPLENGE